MDTNQINHFPDSHALDLAAAVEAELEAFKSGEVILRGLSASSLREILGLDSHGETKETGLRFRDSLDGEVIESYPNFAGKNPLIDKDDPDGLVSGVVKVTFPNRSYNIDIIVEKYDLGTAGIEYSLTLIPDVAMSETTRRQYLTLLTGRLSQA